MNKRTFWTIIFAIIILFTFVYIRSIDEDSWLCTKTGWIEHGKPNAPKPETPCGVSEEHFVVEKYIGNHISELSPQKEVLGGSFFVTKISWIENNLGRVEYEDGHIALQALFDYIITKDEKNNTYTISIINFKNI